MKNNLLIDSVDFESEVKGVTSSISFFIGRSDTCHVVLDDPQVSREHAELTFNNGVWTLKKLAELSIILINGNPISETNIQSGDIISISNYSITVFIPPVIVAPVIENEPLTSTVGVTETLPESEALEDEAATEMMDMDSLDESSDESLDESPSDELDGEPDVGEENTVEEFNMDDEVDDDFSPSDDDKDEELFDDDFSSDDGGDGFDGGYGVDGFDGDDGGEKTVVFSGFSKFELEIFGEFAPFDRYNIENGDILIGRDEKCNIILNDPEVSTIHASIKKNNVLCILEDKNSANGTLLNGARINSNELVNGDEFIIGSTTFTVKVQSDLIEQEKDRLMPVQENQEIEVEEIQEVETDFTDDEFDLGEEEEAPKSLVGKFVKAWKNPDQRKKIIYGLVVVVGAWLMLGDEFSSSPPENKAAKQAAVKKASKTSAGKVNLTPEQLEFISSRYELSKEFVDVGKYSEAIVELDSVMSIDPNFKNSKQLYDIAKQGRSKLELLEQKKQAELAQKERERKIKILIEKATDAVEKHQGDLARELFSQIMQHDPENYDVPQLKNQLEAWEKEQERIKVEKAEKIRERNLRVSKLAPGKNLYLKKQWFKAIGELETFLRIKEMDEDLTKEGAEMLKESKNNLALITGPLLGKARSLREGQDLKGAYENYKIVLRHDPVNLEAIKEMGAIRETLELRAKKIYREAIINESLSLFEEAKHKFQEVQQIAPTDSDYYDKSTNKLKEYME